MYKIKSFDLGSVLLYSFLMYLILGLLIFIPLGLFISIISNFIPDTGEFNSSIFSFFGGMFLFLIPIFYAIAGSIVNAIIVLIYNLLSKKFGGIKLAIEKVDDQEKIIEY
jgi:ABC-type polysaccharide/polyol phosphate export permease